MTKVLDVFFLVLLSVLWTFPFNLCFFCVCVCVLRMKSGKTGLKNTKCDNNFKSRHICILHLASVFPARKNEHSKWCPICEQMNKRVSQKDWQNTSNSLSEQFESDSLSESFRAVILVQKNKIRNPTVVDAVFALVRVLHFVFVVLYLVFRDFWTMGYKLGKCV